LSTSGFIDDVTFRRNASAWKAEPLTYTTTSGVAIPGRSLMFMNALCLFIKYKKIKLINKENKEKYYHSPDGATQNIKTINALK